MYGVVVCSRCGRARGVRIGQKTASCQCGHKIDLSMAKVGRKTEDARELARAVGLENAKLSGGLEDCEKVSLLPRKRKGAHGRAATAAERAGNRDAKVRVVAEELSRELGTFTVGDFGVVLVSLGIQDPQKLLEELSKANFIYEPSPGRFRVV